MGDWSKNRYTPKQVANYFGANLPEHIRYDPKVVHQYRIIRVQTYDGTLMFRDSVLNSMMHSLFVGASYYKPDGLPGDDEFPVYTVGDFKIATVYGVFDLKCGRFPGQRESIILPVRVEWFKRK